MEKNNLIITISLDLWLNYTPGMLKSGKLVIFRRFFTGFISYGPEDTIIYKDLLEHEPETIFKLEKSFTVIEGNIFRTLKKYMGSVNVANEKIFEFSLHKLKEDGWMEV